MNLKYKYAIGCLVQWYEVEILGEYIESVNNALDQIDNKENVIIESRNVITFIPSRKILKKLNEQQSI